MSHCQPAQLQADHLSEFQPERAVVAVELLWQEQPERVLVQPS